MLYVLEVLDGRLLPILLGGRLLTEGPRPEFKPCPICGGPVPADGRMAYCSESCARIALRRQKRDYMRKKRR